MNPLLILLGKLIIWLSKTFNLGSGSTWPGHIAMETNPGFLKQIVKTNPKLKVILIAGTNGKTTTSLILQTILQKSGKKVFRNAAGANLINGIASSIIENASISGKLDFDVAIFETDENNFAFASKEVPAYGVLLLNLFRDQLDRYGEVNTIAEKWHKILEELPPNTLIFANGDDPKLTQITSSLDLKIEYFGIEESFMDHEKNPYDVDFTYCPVCKNKLDYEQVSFSHLGKYSCNNCGFKNPKTVTFKNLPHPLFGKYNLYNLNAAALVANKAFEIPDKTISESLAKIKPAFGRQEEIDVKGKKTILLLSKNPAGFNQSIEAINSLRKRGNILVVLNDRIPDGRDISWIWDVDFEKLPPKAKIYVSGDRAYDMGIRMRYSGDRQGNTEVIPDLKNAIDKALENTSKDERLYILPTYSAMLETRKILTGKKIL